MRNHLPGTWACDFYTVTSQTFRRLHVPFAVVPPALERRSSPVRVLDEPLPGGVLAEGGPRRGERCLSLVSAAERHEGPHLLAARPDAVHAAGTPGLELGQGRASAGRPRPISAMAVCAACPGTSLGREIPRSSTRARSWRRSVLATPAARRRATGTAGWSWTSRS